MINAFEFIKQLVLVWDPERFHSHQPERLTYEAEKSGERKKVIVPYHSKSLKKGLEDSILKQAGLK